MSNKIDFDFHELNALNKLLGSIKFEADFDADEVNSFATSPFIISAFQKIHINYLEAVKAQSLLQPSNEPGFLMFDNSTNQNINERIKALNRDTKDYLKSLSEQDKLAYCDILCAPFIPTETIKMELMETLESLSLEDK